MSTVSGVLGLLIIFAVTAWVVQKDMGNVALLVGLAATLPKQIEMTHQVHSLALGWNDLLALWVRAGGVMSHMNPAVNKVGEKVGETPVASRITFEKLHLRQTSHAGNTEVQCNNLKDALAIVLMQPLGRINVRGSNGAGKSTLLVALKEQLRGKAYYWPTADRLSFAYVDETLNDDDQEHHVARPQGFSSGEQQIAALTEIVAKTSAAVYLLDEWDANLDSNNRAQAQALIDQLARRARVVEISHRDAPNSV